MARYRLKKPKLIGDLINKTLIKHGIFDKIKEYYIYIIWDEEVGKNISAPAKPIFFKHGKLFVKVDSSIWLNELKFLKDKIKEKINAKLETNKVKEIYFRIK